MSTVHIQAKLNQKLKLLQDKKKIVKNLKSLELFEKGVQEEIERLTPEKKKFEEWARYFGSEDAKTRQVLKWFNDELKKLNEKADRAHSMRTKILAVQEQIDLQIQHLNMELDQLRTEALRVPQPEIQKSPARFEEPKPTLPAAPPAFRQKTVLPDESDLIPDSLLEEVLFNKSVEKTPVSFDQNKFPKQNAAESEPVRSFEKDHTPDTQKIDSFEFQNWTKDKPEEPLPKTAVFQEPPPREIITAKSASTEAFNFPGRNADFLFKEVSPEKEEREVILKNPQTQLPSSGAAKQADFSTDFLNLEKPQTVKEPALKVPRGEYDDFLAIEEDTQQDMKQFKLPQPEVQIRATQPEDKKEESRNEFLDDFLKQTSEKREKSASLPPIMPQKSVEQMAPIPDSTEFDDFEVFEKDLKQQSPKLSLEEHKINYIKNQPIRPVEDVPPPVQMKSEPKVPEMPYVQEAKPKRIEPAPAIVKPAAAPPEKKEQVFRQVAVEKEEAVAKPAASVNPPKTAVPRLSRTDVLYLGIDLGTYETTVAASNGEIATTISAVGWPKDVVSLKMLRKDVLVGEEALRNKLALHFFRPLEHGVIKNTDEDLKAAKELIKYAIKSIHPEKYKKVYAVIGAPAQAKLQNHQAILEAAREIIDAVTIVSEPFSVAYGEANIYNTLVIDIGAGTTDICRLKGTMPTEEDQVSFIKAGDYIDNQLIQSIINRVKGAQVTKDMARRWKEAHSFVMQSSKPVVVEITVEGKPLRVDITNCIQKSCEAIVDDLVAASKSLISTFDPEFQMDLKQNILLAGGGSLIRNLDKLLAQQMSNMGRVVVKRVPNPIEAGARGALALAMDLTDDYWRGLAI